MHRSLTTHVLLASLTLGLLNAGCGDAPLATTPRDEPVVFEGQVEVPAHEPTSLAFVAPEAPDESTSCVDLPYRDRVVEMGEAFAPEGIAVGDLDSCQVPLYRGVASAGMRLEARLSTAEPDAGLQLLRFDTHELNGDLGLVAGRGIAREGEAVVEWFAPQTGEYGLAVELVGPAAEVPFALEVRCVAECDRGMTRYPIVLMHGMGGADEILDLVEYYNGVHGALTEAGYDVYVTVVDPLASSRDRSQQLVPQLEGVLEQTGASRLNLIGHSQGGVDGRALVSALDFGDRAASLTTVATPHHGSPLVDMLLGLLDDSKVVESLVDAVGDLYGRLLGRDDQDMPAAFREMSVSYMTEIFNPAHPDDPRVAYYSWAGRTCALLEIECQRENNGEVVAAMLAPAYRVLQILGVEESDGLVGVESAQWGEFLGVLPADHLDEIGLLFDLPSDAFDHLAFYLSEAQRLFEAGY